MCGICASIARQDFRSPSENLLNLLKARGPDHIGQTQSTVEGEKRELYYISLTSTVLSLRGGHITAQPFVDLESSSALCWNGEAWKIGPVTVKGNDGQAVFDLLVRASSSQVHAAEAASSILDVLRSISGPCAFVFLDKAHNQMFFGRDRLGRRSLLYKFDGVTGSLEFSSIADPTDHGSWQEVEADGIYQLSFKGHRFSAQQGKPFDLLSNPIGLVLRHDWEGVDLETGISLGLFNKSPPEQNYVLDSRSKSIDILHGRLNESLNVRLLDIPQPLGMGLNPVRVAILFSGGLDCTVLARIAHEILPGDQQIDLLNVAFENPRVVRAAKNKSKPGKSQSKKHELLDDNISRDTEISEDSNGSSPFEMCPDRITGRKAFQELRDVCPSRVWRFVAVNVPYTETMAHRSKVVNLIYPHNTEMDLSIAFALYFASRGLGEASINLESTPIPYTTPARVLLSGLGADELFGGYTRHATAFNRNGFPGLLDELKIDVDRLGKRNLGRDDRVISHWGREARFPYLDEALVKWAVECPIWEKCGFQSNPPEKQELPAIEPGKKVLRLLAYKLGMHSVATEKKRAIQFGARTAKMELGNTKGTTLIS